MFMEGSSLSSFSCKGEALNIHLQVVALQVSVTRLRQAEATFGEKQAWVLVPVSQRFRNFLSYLFFTVSFSLVQLGNDNFVSLFLFMNLFSHGLISQAK